jgi:hypothetical protein
MIAQDSRGTAEHARVLSPAHHAGRCDRQTLRAWLVTACIHTYLNAS